MLLRWVFSYFKIWVDTKCLCQVTMNVGHTASQQKKHSESLNQGSKHTAHSDHSVSGKGIIRNSLPGKKTFNLILDVQISLCSSFADVMLKM